LANHITLPAVTNLFADTITMTRRKKGPPCDSMLLARCQTRHRHDDDNDNDDDSDWIPPPLKKARSKKNS